MHDKRFVETQGEAIPQLRDRLHWLCGSRGRGIAPPWLPTLAEIMGVPLPPNDEYELSGKSLWPYLTGKAQHHREWIYGFKGPSQMARDQQVLRDGHGHWYDVSEVPANLDNFPRIDDLDALTDAQAEERAMIETVLKRFAREDVGGLHSFREDPARKLSGEELEKMRLKAETQKRHLEKPGGVREQGWIGEVK